jgi:ABC-2 type transport system ATP-binding protein
MTTDYAIEANGLQKIYQNRWRSREFTAVAGLSLRVPAGIKFGLLGANGAGKTTFVKMLLSSVWPTAGRASLFGLDSRDPESRRPVGYLPENHRFPTYFTGSGMLDFYGALSGMGGPERRRRTAELLELVGLQDWGDVRIKKYSKGMLQRLGLAQAVMHRPRLLILDEPTDGVDPVGRRHIRDILNGLTGKGVTIFLNSHLLSEVETFCDYVAILNRGQLALEGKMSDLLTGRGYRVTALHVTGTVRDKLQAVVGGIQPTRDGLELTAATAEQLNEAIDQLRAGGAMIQSVIPTSSSLEELFITTTGKTSGNAEGQADGGKG